MAEQQDADRLIARALESVLESVPDVPGGDISMPEQSPTSQPWAETAAPAGRDKRPLADLLAEYEARVAAAPGARANLPKEPHPGQAYLDKLSPASEGGRRKRRWHGGGKRRGGGRRRGRGGGGGGGGTA